MKSKVNECEKKADKPVCHDGYYYPGGTWFLNDDPNTQYCTLNDCRAKEKTKTVEYKRIDDFRKEITWFSQNEADNQTVCTAKTWQSVPEGFQTCGNGSISVKMIYTFKEATGGKATMSTDSLRGSLK